MDLRPKTREDKDVPEEVISDTIVRVDPFPPTDAQSEAIDVITRADKKKKFFCLVSREMENGGIPAVCSENSG